MVKGKKAVSMGSMYPAVLTIVVVGIVLGIGLLILAQTQTATTFQKTVVNESVTPTDSGTAVATATDCAFNTFAVTQALNATTYTVIGAGNYSVEASTGKIINLTSEYVDSAWNVTYTYYSGEDGDASSDNYCDAFSNTITGTAGLASWIAVIVVVLAAAIVLGIVLGSFGRGPGV